MDFKKVTIYCSDPDKQLIKMLNKIGSLANPGHSFDVVLDPNDSENRSTFYFDGDGSFSIRGIHEEDVDLEEVKKNSTKMQTKDGTKMGKKYNPMTMMLEEDRSRVKDANEFTSKGYKLELNQIRAINNLADNGFSTIAIIKDSTGKVIKRSGISGWTEAAVEKKAVAWFDEFIKGVSKAKDSNFTSKVLVLGDRAIKFANNATENKSSSNGYKGNKNQAYKLLDEIDTLVAAEDTRGNIEAKRMGERASKFRNSVDKIFKEKTKDVSLKTFQITCGGIKGMENTHYQVKANTAAEARRKWNDWSIKKKIDWKVKIRKVEEVKYGYGEVIDSKTTDANNYERDGFDITSVEVTGDSFVIKGYDKLNKENFTQKYKKTDDNIKKVLSDPWITWKGNAKATLEKLAN